MYFLLGEVIASEEEGGEDIAPLHIVNTDIGEMPEGAQASDGEELDSRPNDDPHKALDINLDEYVLHIFIPHHIEQLQVHTCSSVIFEYLQGSMAPLLTVTLW
jgi:hypothetical protein